MRMTRFALPAIAIAAGLGLTPSFAAEATSAAPVIPTPEQLPELAASFLELLRDVSVTTPDGRTLTVAEGYLDRGRIERILRTIGDNEAWPAVWLVAQDSGETFDVVLRVTLDAQGSISKPGVAFAAKRREWNDAAFETAYREATGAKPPKDKRRNLVVVTFSKRTETTYVYDLPKTGKDAKGLLSLLPPGALLRESLAIDLGDGNRHTLAVILMHPKFVPSSCAPGAGAHHDRAAVRLYLAGETELEGALDVVPAFGGAAGAEMDLPRYACDEADASAHASAATIESRFADRDPIQLLARRPRPGGGFDIVLLDKVVAKAVVEGEKARLRPAD